ncbi:hypothetical protein GCM10007875_21650 [Limnobacter litoralis]|uniref:Uncharacterized protein n=1 Tax=Limnobacter litoralis TaxID=481366 RepID=A0ABQ5YSG6_9BURK|nr:hypothetical protein GCM10007875_21650 [Limnobacter litoralis]
MFLWVLDQFSGTIGKRYAFSRCGYGQASGGSRREACNKHASSNNEVSPRCNWYLGLVI